MKNLYNTDPVDDDSDGLFEIVNLHPDSTGLPFVVWMTPKADNKHDVRIKISMSPKYRREELFDVAIRPEICVLGDAAIKPHDLALLKKWIALNYDTIIKFWDEEIEYAEDLLAVVKPLQSSLVGTDIQS